MLNVFYWYSITWGSVFVLYELGWSSYCTDLGPVTTSFFLMSIIVSLILGVIFRDRFVYSNLIRVPNRNKAFTYIILIGGMADFIYSRDIPLISIIGGWSSYTDFSGIPLIHTLLENSIIFYSAYLFYLFLELRDKKILKEMLEILSILLLMFHKGALMFCLFMIINLAVAKAINEGHVLNIKHIILFICIVILLAYINGGLTNLRSGFSWNNQSLPRGVSRINSKWPSWLPLQFSWAYTYIVSPLANLNYNLIRGNNTHSVGMLVASIIPDAFVKRLLPNFQLSESSVYLITPVLNACTGFIESVAAYGRFGLWFFYISFTIIMLIVVYFRCNINQNCAPVYLSLLCMMTVFLFFYNTLRTAATSFIPLMIILSPIFSRFKFVISKK